MSEDVKQIGADLTAEQQAELEQIKNYHGLKNTADTVRFLIRQEARTIRNAAPLFAPNQHQEVSV